MDIKSIILLITCSVWCSVNVNAVYTDCERPPTILHGKTELSVDDDGIVVTGIYTCDNGYRLHGQAELFCDTDTDEWQGELPICKQEGEGSPAEEIKEIDLVSTTPKIEITHEELATEESQHDIVSVSPVWIPEQEPEQPELVQSATVPQQKRRRKGKNQEAEEDTTIDVEFASRLDTTCVGDSPISAPTINDAYVLKYNRRKKGDHIFLVAIYECDEDYALENSEENRLYCSNQNWIGKYPVCISKFGDSDLDYEGELGEDETEDQFENKQESNVIVQENENEILNENAGIVNKEVILENRNDFDETSNVVVHSTAENSDPNAIESISESRSLVDCRVNNGGCEQNCAVILDEKTGQNQISCSCTDGFALDIDNKQCVEITEPNAEVEIIATNGEVTVVTTEAIDLTPIKACGDGLRLDASNTCLDIDECQEGNTGCEYCQNEIGFYRCTCPDGFVLNSDEKTCRDIDECTTYSEYDYDENTPTAHSICSHECINTIGSWICKCPLNFHLRPDKRTCERDLCQHLGDTAANKTKCSHECVDESDGYHCKCPDGLELDSDQKTCISRAVERHESLNLCQNENGGCSDICNVVEGHVVCNCVEGSILSDDGKTCKNPNLCAVNNGGCAHVCNVEENRCECFPGFETNDNGKTCADVNECFSNNGGCSQECVNNEGGFECGCFLGFTESPDNGECIDVDECQVKNGNCDHECTNTLGSYVCTCRHGYRNAGNQHQCVDVNECETNNGNCSNTCINLPGSYQCSCPEGQFLVNDDHTCDYLNECEINNGGCSHECNYKSGVIQCICPNGYQLDGDLKKNCIDINECLVNNGGCSHNCENFDGKHLCKCNVGFQLGTDKGTCIDVDECIEDNGNCSNICINLFGSYSCACEAGFELDVDRHTCVDIDECNDKIHDCSHNCINVPGTYECDCPAGYNLSRDHFNCIDIDECNLENSCVNASNCVNTIGSFYCNCPDGHELSPHNKTCIDINECNDQSIRRCSHECENIIGAFKCLCPAGMNLASDLVTCIDINECELKTNNCSHLCDNIEGGFRCRCPNGYELDTDQITCKDINECAIGNGQCEQLCVNTDGNYKCECKEDGFKLATDEKTCINSDPCAIKNGGCAHVCEPLHGKPQCYCYKGFELSIADNSSCIDINECLLNHGCQSKCVNTVGSYKCDCPEGFRLNDVGHCIDINECEHFNGGCSPQSECINFLGSFRCICPTGFKLSRDKVTCAEIKDNCAAITPPENGDVRCTRSRHRTQLYYKTKCSIWCREGFTLVGPAVKYCNGSGGTWESTETLCVPESCPHLNQPNNGILSPPDCVTGKIYPGESCTLQCSSGFKPIAASNALCQKDQKWSSTQLNCVANEVAPQRRILQGETHTRGHVEVEESAPRLASHTILRPYIKCPRDTTIILPNGKKTVYVKLEQPKTNVDWKNHVDVHPLWAKNLEAHLTAGEHTITFRARSPNAANINEVCRTIITVKATTYQAPQVLYCPPAIEVQLRTNELQRALAWKEPSFRASHQLKQIFKSKLPGSQFGAGVHRITYIATDVNNQNGRCEFTITVKAAPVLSRIVNNVYRGNRLENHLENHESYLLCSGKPAMKLDTSFPVQIPNGCFVKNVRVNHYNPHRRRHTLSSNNNMLRLYTSWDRPDFRRYW